MTNWKKMLLPPVWTGRQRQYFVVCRAAEHRVGLVTEITRALSMAILDIAALGFLDLGAQLPSPEWGAMLGDALELIYVAPWTMLPGSHYGERAACQPAGRRYSPCN
jgi:hypothetical protein